MEMSKDQCEGSIFCCRCMAGILLLIAIGMGVAIATTKMTFEGNWGLLASPLVAAIIAFLTAEYGKSKMDRLLSSE
jgi:hypothetical protein